MRKIDMAQARLAVEVLKDEATTITNSLKDKGAKHFIRPLVVAATVLYSSYAFVYLPPIKKLKQLDAKLTAAKAAAQYADSYGGTHERLFRLYAQLPLPRDRDQWLFNSLVDSLKAENIVSNSLQPPQESEQAGLVYQNIGMNSTLKYSEIISWLDRIESAKPALLTSHLDIAKIQEPIGENQVSCVINTIIPKNRFAP